MAQPTVDGAWHRRGLNACDHEIVAAHAFDPQPFRAHSGAIGPCPMFGDDAFEAEIAGDTEESFAVRRRNPDAQPRSLGARLKSNLKVFGGIVSPKSAGYATCWKTIAEEYT